jgi:hypothetical protein
MLNWKSNPKVEKAIRAECAVCEWAVGRSGVVDHPSTFWCESQDDTCVTVQTTQHVTLKRNACPFMLYQGSK